MKKDLSRIKLIKVHGGRFHADDVCCVAMLRLLNCSAPVEHVFEIKPEDDVPEIISFDLLHADYDHHMPKDECPTYPDGTHYASFGLFCKDLGFDTKYGEEFANVVKLIDNFDNGDKIPNKHFISELATLLNPNWNEAPTKEALELAFNNAVDMIANILKRIIIKSDSEITAREEVTQALQESTSDIVILKRYAPWEKYIKSELGKFAVVYPDTRGGYTAKIVQGSRYALNKKLPEEWSGAAEKDLPEGIRFCSKNGDLLAGVDLDSVLRALEKTVPYDDILMKAIEKLNQLEETSNFS